VVCKELAKYNPELAEKTELIVLSKSDAADSKKIAKVKKEFKKLKKKVFVISLFDDKAIKDFGDSLIKILRKKEK